MKPSLESELADMKQAYLGSENACKTIAEERDRLEAENLILHGERDGLLHQKPEIEDKVKRLMVDLQSCHDSRDVMATQLNEYVACLATTESQRDRLKATLEQSDNYAEFEKLKARLAEAEQLLDGAVELILALSPSKWSDDPWIAAYHEYLEAKEQK